MCMSMSMCMCMSRAVCGRLARPGRENVAENVAKNARTVRWRSLDKNGAFLRGVEHGRLCDTDSGTQTVSHELYHRGCIAGTQAVSRARLYQARSAGRFGRVGHSRNGKVQRARMIGAHSQSRSSSNRTEQNRT